MKPDFNDEDGCYGFIEKIDLLKNGMDCSDVADFWRGVANSSLFEECKIEKDSQMEMFIKCVSADAQNRTLNAVANCLGVTSGSLYAALFDGDYFDAGNKKPMGFQALLNKCEVAK
jgi:hypothetical protein